MLNEEIIKQLLGSEELTAREIKEKYFNDNNISLMKLVSILKKMEDIEIVEHFHQTCYGRNRKTTNSYRVVEKMSFTGNVEKQKNILKLELDNNDFIIYDFDTQTFISNKYPNTRIKNQDKNIVLQIFCNKKYTNLQQTEWLYSYIDLLDNDLKHYINFDFKTCPSGYIKWLKDNDKKINTISYLQYFFTTQYPKVPIPLLNQHIEGFLRKDSYYSDYTIPWISKRLNVYNILYGTCNLEKIFKNSLKKCEFDIETYLDRLVKLIKDFHSENLNLINYIDNNRTLKDNISNLYHIVEKQKNTLLIKNLQKLNFLNNITINDYIIIVPQSIEDLIQEGKQQHNCVGHYYNDSIAKGENLIYFLRKQDTPQKSVVTCRYNLDKKSTCEHRTINNNFTTQEQNNIIAQIDKIINENL